VTLTARGLNRASLARQPLLPAGDNGGMAASDPPTRRLGCIGRLLAGVGIMLAAYLLALVFIPPVLTATRAAVLLPEMINLPVRPLQVVTSEPQRSTTSYGTPPDRLDIYVPADARPDGKLPAVVLVLGFHPVPVDDPDIVRIATGISRLGIVVGVQDSTSLRESRLDPNEPAHITDALLVLAQRPEVDRARLGLIGFSAGGSLALMAAADPRIAVDLRFVSNFGGYADAETFLVDIATRTMELEGGVLPWQSGLSIRLEILELMLSAIDPPAERDALRAQLEPIFRLDEPPGGPDPAIEAGFSADALAAYQLFTAADRQAAGAAIEQVSASLRAELTAISPLAVIDRIQAQVFTLHGETDSAVPISHAVALNEALEPEKIGLFTRFGRVGHEPPFQGGVSLDDLPDLWQLTLYLHHIVAAATES
jgi:predicted esterase